MGYQVGDSLLEPDWIMDCKDLLETGRVKVPVDVVIAQDISRGCRDPARRRVAASRTGGRASTSGPETAGIFADTIASAANVLWNGPMGVFELPPFAAGTLAVAEAVADCRGFTVIGGGDSAAAIRQFGLGDRVDHVSTGGGASLEFIEQGDLPGLAALRKRKEGLMADRKPIIAGNWKMFHDHFTAIQFTQKLSYLLDKKDYDERRRRALPAVHGPAVGADDDRQRTASRSSSARRTATGRRKARSPAR